MLGFAPAFVELHRWMGRTYVIAVSIGGLGALRMAAASQQGWVTHVGFGLLAVLWLFSTTRAYIAIRSRAQARHRRWMIRSYSLTLAAVTLRIYLPLSLALGLPLANAYRVISWMCWVPNIILAEWLVRRTQAPIPAVAGDTLVRREALVGSVSLDTSARAHTPTVGSRTESQCAQLSSWVRTHSRSSSGRTR